MAGGRWQEEPCDRGGAGTREERTEMLVVVRRCTCGVSSLAALEAQQVTGANDGVSELLMPSTAATSN